MAMTFMYSLLSVVVCGLVSGVSGDYCDQYNGTTIYCPEVYCCGSPYTRSCCFYNYDYDTIEDTSSDAVVAGIVIGVLMFVIIVISLIVCCVCCLRRSRGRPGHVIGHGGTTTLITNTSPYHTGPVQTVVFISGQPANPSQPAYNTEQPAYNTDQPSYNTEQPAYNTDQPAYNTDQPAYNTDQPAVNLGTQSYNPEHTEYRTLEQSNTPTGRQHYSNAKSFV